MRKMIVSGFIQKHNSMLSRKLARIIVSVHSFCRGSRPIPFEDGIIYHDLCFEHQLRKILPATSSLHPK